MKKINVALIGFGLSGRYLQAPFFEKSTDFCLKTVMTSQQDWQALYPQTGRADSMAEVLADAAIDLVSICSPNETHFDYARQCLLAGKHVLVEKPFTATAAEAEELIALAQKQGRHIFAFQNRRFDSDFLTIQQLLGGGRLGGLLRYEAHFNRFKPLLNPKKWKEIPAASNGILYDLGAHLIDQCIALFGAPQAVQGETYTQRAGSDIDDAFDIWLDYGTMKAYLHASLMVREPAPRYVLHGTEASFVKYGIDQQEDQLRAGLLPGMPGFGEEPAALYGTLYTEAGDINRQEIMESQPGNWQALFDNMADVLLRGAAAIIRMEEVVQQLQVIGQVRRREKHKLNNMAYDESTAQNIRQVLLDKGADFTEKKMFSGVCFLVDDKMCCGTHIDKKTGESLLLCRIGEAAYENALEQTGCIPMDFTGKSMKGYVFVTEDGLHNAADLGKWLQLCLDFNPVAKKSKK